MGGWEERAKALSPFKAAGTQAPSPAQAWQGRGGAHGMLLGPQKDCSFPVGQTPTPTPVLSLPPISPAPSSAKGRLKESLRAAEKKNLPQV